MEALLALAAALGTEAVKTWGAYAISLLLLGVGCWTMWGRLKAKDAEIEALEGRITAAKEKRLEDALQMIQVARSGTETMATRSQSDARFLEAFRRLTDEVAELRERLPPPRRIRGRP